MKTSVIIILIVAAGSLNLGEATNGKAVPSPNELKQIKRRAMQIFHLVGEVHPTALRLAFHQCAGGECDGCINIDQEDNKGLEFLVKAFEFVLEMPLNRISGPKVKEYMTRADLWSLAGIAAVEFGIQQANNLCLSNDPAERERRGCIPMPQIDMEFQHGRKDCPTAPYTTQVHKFPVPIMNRTEMLNYFKDEFDLAPNEVVALMGAHTLGRCRPENFGYVGPWTPRPGPAERYFNTQYYRFLVSDEFEFRCEAKDEDSSVDKKFQFDLYFNRTETWFVHVGMMLPTDVALVSDIDVHPTHGTTCKVNNNYFGHGPRCNFRENAGLCTPAPDNTASLARTYAQDSNVFMNDFRAAFAKMMQRGYAQSDLTAIQME